MVQHGVGAVCTVQLGMVAFMALDGVMEVVFMDRMLIIEVTAMLVLEIIVTHMPIILVLEVIEIHQVLGVAIMLEVTEMYEVQIVEVLV